RLVSLTPTATADIYTLSLHDALPISIPDAVRRVDGTGVTMAHWAAALLNNGLGRYEAAHLWAARADALHHPLHATSVHALVAWRDRKSTRLNSSHVKISYAVFCLKKK